MSQKYHWFCSGINGFQAVRDFPSMPRFIRFCPSVTSQLLGYGSNTQRRRQAAFCALRICFVSRLVPEIVVVVRFGPPSPLLFPDLGGKKRAQLVRDTSANMGAHETFDTKRLFHQTLLIARKHCIFHPLWRARFGSSLPNVLLKGLSSSVPASVV